MERFHWILCDIQNVITLLLCQVLKSVDALRKKVVSIGKEHASLCAKVRHLALSEFPPFPYGNASSCCLIKIKCGITQTYPLAWLKLFEDLYYVSLLSNSVLLTFLCTHSDFVTWDAFVHVYF